ncbi:cyanophycin synthetase [Thermomonas hydrothermalis]|uniref:Cyanophycin synthetase n=1 Tax=Thermomonas hydrothermalis TaxID=213588 RepID=A0A1M4VGS6_9GAMM|nr:cyanophycin synthetase [Thermomonas hydrothermalis]SHE68015.1 cyanophycin synthetase [Thermomonas hydrothermalis]
MDITRIRALRGPNLWTRKPAIEAIVTLSQGERPLDSLPGFEERLRQRFPELGFLRTTRQSDTLTLAHALEFTALCLQAQAGCPVTFSRTARTVDPGVFQVVVEYSEEAVGRRALTLALQLCLSARDDTPFDLDAALAELRALDEDVRLGPSTGSIVEAAVNRGIPYRRLNTGSLVQFGWGCKQRRIQAAEMDCTSAIAEAIAQDKALTKKLLRAAGVPVPDGRPVSSADDAWAAAQEIGLPVVVKPLDGNQGKGVTVNLRSEDEIRRAYEVARTFRDDVMVERYLPGGDYRLLVVGNRLVAAARREPPNVIGDGVSSVRALVEQVNADPRRGDGHATALTRIRLDEIALRTLEKQGLTPDSVPEKGRRVVLRNNANLSTGGTATDVTGDVHPELAARAIDAARMVGLDICGVDVVCETVLRPLEEQGGGIVEVNAAPGLRMHLAPSYGKPRDVGKAIIDAMFPPGETGRIPIVAVTGTNGKTTTVRLIAHLLRCRGWTVGMTSTDGVYVDGMQIDSGDCAGPSSARRILMHPHVEAAVFETARGGLLREGLAFDQADVAVVTNIGMGDHLGLNFITTVDDLAVLKRVVVRNVARTGHAVLNAADPVVAAMAAHCPGKVIFFARDPAEPVLAAHRAQGGKVVFVQQGDLVAAEDGVEMRLPLAEVPMTGGGRIGFQVENALAALAAGWALGLDWGIIRQGLASFKTNAGNAPGRFNLMAYRGATVIADYGHNPDAMRALVAAVDNLPATRRLVVISGAGDRRDEDIRQQTRILGEAFDEVILYQDACQRGRADGEVLALLRQGLEGATRTRVIEEIRGELAAIDRALEKLGPGDLCLILIDQVELALQHLRARIAAG